MSDQPDPREKIIYSRPPLKAETPTQVGSVVGVDRMDEIDRARQNYRTKLELLAIETKNLTGRDPRGGGHAFVGRPRVVLQLLLDANEGAHLLCEIRMAEPVVIGTVDADLVGWWQGVPILVRSNCVADKLYCLRRDKIPDSSVVDRRRAGELRMAARYDKLKTLRG